MADRKSEPADSHQPDIAGAEAQRLRAIPVVQSSEIADDPAFHHGGFVRGEDFVAALDLVARLEQKLKHWQTCENCGEPLHGPGICDQAITERERSLELMHDETLTRAEQAEAHVARLEQEKAQLEVIRDQLSGALSVRDHQYQQASADLA